MLTARAATIATVPSDIRLCSIMRSLAQPVKGATSAEKSSARVECKEEIVDEAGFPWVPGRGVGGEHLREKKCAFGMTSPLIALLRPPGIQSPEPGGEEPGCLAAGRLLSAARKWLVTEMLRKCSDEECKEHASATVITPELIQTGTGMGRLCAKTFAHE